MAREINYKPGSQTQVNPLDLTPSVGVGLSYPSKNGLYISFVNMVGQHFDHVWTYIKHITEFHNSSNIKGISKD